MELVVIISLRSTSWLALESWHWLAHESRALANFPLCEYRSVRRRPPSPFPHLLFRMGKASQAACRPKPPPARFSLLSRSLNQVGGHKRTLVEQCVLLLLLLRPKTCHMIHVINVSFTVHRPSERVNGRKGKPTAAIHFGQQEEEGGGLLNQMWM